MSKLQNGLGANSSETRSADFQSNDPFEALAKANGTPCEEFESDDDSDLSGHTLLSRPQAPQGRRSLFRR